MTKQTKQINELLKHASKNVTEKYVKQSPTQPKRINNVSRTNVK